MMNQLQKEATIEKMLELIVKQPKLHARWLETMSYLENRGAHKIVHYQPCSHVDLALLQHTAEEARHAFFFKNQISKIVDTKIEPSCFLGKRFARRYLDLLELVLVRVLRRGLHLKGRKLQEACYLLTSYAIEIRANELYRIYENLLRKYDLPFSLKSILQEEKSHLAQIESAIANVSDLLSYKSLSLVQERILYKRFLSSLYEDLKPFVA